MTISETGRQPDRAYVWFWLPGETNPTLAGRVDQDGPTVTFRYAPSYLESPDAIAIYRELPLEPGAQRPRGLIHGCIADAAPDAWGQRVILNQRLGAGHHDTTDLTQLTYLTSSGPDRIGALDFQVEPGRYHRAHVGTASLDDLLAFAVDVENGTPVPAELNDAILRGSSIGGARPKALLDAGDQRLIAKFSSSFDSYPVVQGEFVAMRLAALCRLEVAPVEINRILDRYVLLVERFDRPNGTRRAMVSALTVLGLAEEEARYASYAGLAHLIRRDFHSARATLRELFSRITFNILVSNLDDHARNQSAFWDGQELTLTPAYDICPSPRSGGETQQVMAIGDDGWRYSQLEGCVKRSGTYLLTAAQAREIIDHQAETIRANWEQVCDEARLTVAQRRSFWERQFLNPFAFETTRS